MAPGVVPGALSVCSGSEGRPNLPRFCTPSHSSYTFKNNGLEFDQRPSGAEYTCIMPGTEAILVLVCQPRASLYATLAAEDRLTLAQMPR